MALTDDFKRVVGKITEVADSIRDKTGLSEKMTFEQMAQEVAWLEGETDDTATYILVDENGNEIAAVATDEIVEIDGEANDVREGVTVVTSEGITVGTREIPSYHTYDGFRAVTNGSPFTIPHERYDYTKLQALICLFNTSLVDSVETIKVAIEDRLYNVADDEPVSTLSKDDANHRVDFGIVNDSGKICIVRYIMYKEEY